MLLSIAKSHLRRTTLFLAFAACAIQALNFSLPSLVVCFQAGRPPQIEFFSDSCSCHCEDRHACGEREPSGASCLESACIDVHLDSDFMLADAARPFRALADGLRLLPGVRSQASLLDLRPSAGGRCRPFAEAPPPRSAPLENFRWRC